MEEIVKVCSLCGTSYPDDAEYCNLCRKESLVAVERPSTEERSPFRSDRLALGVLASVWLLGLGLVLAQRRPRTLFELGMGWAFLSSVTLVVALVLRNLRAFALFAVFGLAFVAIYALLRL